MYVCWLVFGPVPASEGGLGVQCDCAKSLMGGCLCCGGCHRVVWCIRKQIFEAEQSRSVAGWSRKGSET